MNKIINWFCGSFIRTIGRFVAFIVIGMLVAVLLQKSNIKITDLLGIQRVYASTYSNKWISGMSFMEGTNGSWRSSLQDGDGYYSELVNIPNYNNYNFKFSSTFNKPTNATKFLINLKMKSMSGTYIDISESDYQCDFDVDVFDLSTGQYESENWQYLYNYFTCEQHNLNGEIESPKFGLSVFYYYGDNLNLYAPCYAKSNSGDYFSFECPVVSDNISGIRVFASGNDYNFKLGVQPFVSFEIDNSGEGTQAIINNQNTNTNATIENQNQNTQNVINNQNANTNATIENQNQNTQAQIDSQKVCNIQQTSNTKNVIQNQVLSNNGTTYSNNSFVITDYYSITNDTKIKVINNYGTTSSWHCCFYNVNKEVLSCINIGTLTINQELTIPNGAKYFRSSVLKSENKPLFEISTCENGNQAMANTLTDTSGPDNLGAINNDTIVGYLPPGPVDSLITLPLVILNGINNSLSTTCSAITLPLPFVNQNIELPCMQSLYDKMGVLTYLNWAGIIASAFLLYSYLIRFYKWVDNVLTFRENNYLDNWGGAD